ncbi:MAG: hypothetical protein JNM43_02395 [Planctomycetaceae bacterium]|nr:hypothetical protein [Planctomycetaceae bacterium]
MRRLILFLIFGLTAVPAFGQSEIDSDRVRNGGGIIWYVGTVGVHAGKRPHIDLGDVHGILEGDTLAVFRAVELHYRPIGTIEVEEANVTWSVPKASSLVQIQEGDRVVAIRTLRQLGTGEEHRENFQRRQLVRHANRNSYSTLLDDEAISVLIDIEEKQARWVKELKPIAGRIRATSVSPNDFKHMQPLLNQVLRFQQFRAIGVPVDKCIGSEWDSVLTTLTPDPAESFSKSHTKKPEVAAAEEQKPAPADEASPASKENDAKIETIHQIVNSVMFDYEQEERKVAMMLCAAIDIENPKNETSWIMAQLNRSQFPDLADDEEMLESMEQILKDLRASQGQ